MRSLRYLVLLLALPLALHAQASWSSRNPAPTDAAIKALAGGNGLYVAVGGSGLILTSTDGVTWKSQILYTKENLNNVSFAGGSFFARGDSGTVFVSTDGRTWLQRVNGNVASGFGPLGHAAASGAGAWVLVGGSDRGVLTSNDATTFTLQPDVRGDHVAFGAGIFLLASTYSSSFATSSDAVTWTTIQPTGLDWASEISFGAGQFIARRGTKLFHSTDALTWTEIPGVSASGVAFVKDRFLALDATTRLPLTSPDGLTWTAAPARAVVIPPDHIASNGDNFVGFLDYKLYRSTDALNWTQSGTDFTTVAIYPGVAFAHDRFLTAEGFTSTDGIDWTSSGYAIPAEFAYDSHVHAANDRFFIFSKKKIYTSADGLAGQKVADLTFNARAIAYGASRYVIIGYNDAGTAGGLATSPDGVTWTEQPLPAGTPSLEALAFAANLFVAVNRDGAIYTSSDGLAWTKRPHPVNANYLNAVAYGAGRWLIAGDPSLTSTDGVTWSRASAPDATTVTFANGTFVLNAYTESANNFRFSPLVSLATSADGVHWTYRDTARLYGDTYVYGAGSWVGVRTYGRIIQSPADDFALAPAFAAGLTAKLAPADPTQLLLTAPASGGDPISYQWFRFGLALSDGTTPSLTANLSNFSNGEVLTLVATNAHGTAILPYQVSTANQGRQLDPDALHYPLQFSARRPSPDQLSLSLVPDYIYYLTSFGPGPVDFQWFKDGVAIPAANGPAITIPYDATQDADSIYSLRVTNLHGAVFLDYTLTPTLVLPPTSRSVRLDESTALTANAKVPANAGDITFTWKKDGQVVRTATVSSPNAISSIVTDVLPLSRVQSTDYGLYQVTVTNAFGTAATELFDVTPPLVSRLTNLSARARVGTGDDVLIAGYVGSGSTGGPDVLIRGIGPALATLGVSSPLPRAHLGLNNSAGAPFLANDHWDASPGYDAAFLRDLFAHVGAFPLTEGAFDAAVFRPGSLNSTQPPRFTAILSGTGNTTGVGLIELYESAATTQRLVNLSARARVGTGEDILIAGFVIAGDKPLRVLIRGVGPTLAKQGIASPLANPKITLFDATGTAIHNNDQWSDARNLADLRAATTTVGAFALNENSNDAAMLETLAPGVYTVHVTSVGSSTGVALVEIYEAP